MYGCIVTVLGYNIISVKCFCNVSLIFLSVYNVRLQCYQFLIILSNLASELFDQKYLIDEYTCTTLLFFHADRHINYINKETHKKCVDFKCNNSQSTRKKTKKWEEPSLLKTLLLALDKFGFLNFVNIDIENFAGTNFAIAVTETLYF